MDKGKKGAKRFALKKRSAITTAGKAKPRVRSKDVEVLASAMSTMFGFLADNLAKQKKAELKKRKARRRTAVVQQEEVAMAVERYPVHWSESGIEHIRADGARIKIGLSNSSGDKLGRRLGWKVSLPRSIQGNTIDKYDEHFLQAAKYPTVASVLKKVDQTWEPPGHLKAAMPGDWLGHELEQLAREAPSMAHESKAPGSPVPHPDGFPGTEYMG